MSKSSKPAALERRKSTFHQFVVEGGDDALEAARELFELAGTDALSPADLHRVCAELGLDVTRDEVLELMESFDADAHGCVTFDAFSRGVKRMQRFLAFEDAGEEAAPAPKPKKPTRSRPERPRAGSNSMPSPALARKSSVAAFVDQMTREQLLEVERLFEANSEGGVVKREALRSIIRSIDKKMPASGVEELVESVDPDKNGAVTYDQFLRTVHLLFKAMKLRRAERKMRASDDHVEGNSNEAESEKDRQIARLQKTVRKLERKVQEQQQEIDLLRSLNKSKRK